MNPKSLALLLAILVLLACGLFSSRWQILFAIVPLLLMLFEGRVGFDVGVQRAPLTPRVVEGSRVDVSVTFCAGDRPPFTFEVEDSLPRGAVLVEGRNRGVFCLKKGERGELRYAVSLPRGHHVFGPLSIACSNVSGTHTPSCTVEERVETIALTRYEEVHVPIRPKRHRSTVGIFPSRFVGRGREFFSVRNYLWGDEQRIINWKATARSGKLKSNDYESERAVDALIVVDAREEPHAKKHVLDYSLSAALSCAYALLQDKNRVGLLIFSDIQYFIPFDYGRKQFLKFADALSGVTPRGRHPFRYIVGFLRRLSHPCLVIVVSPLSDPEMEDDFSQLAVSPHQLLLVSPSAIEVEWGTMPHTPETAIARRLLAAERKMLLRRLSSYAKVIDWDTTESLLSKTEALK